MTAQDINQLVLGIVVGAILLWVPIDATGSIGRGVAIGLFAIFCFFGLKNAVISDHFHKSDEVKDKAVIIFYLLYGIIFYFIMQYAYEMTYLNEQCYENDNDDACQELEYRVNN